MGQVQRQANETAGLLSFKCPAFHCSTAYIKDHLLGKEVPCITDTKSTWSPTMNFDAPRRTYTTECRRTKDSLRGNCGHGPVVTGTFQPAAYRVCGRLNSPSRTKFPATRFGRPMRKEYDKPCHDIPKGSPVR